MSAGVQMHVSAGHDFMMYGAVDVRTLLSPPGASSGSADIRTCSIPNDRMHACHEVLTIRRHALIYERHTWQGPRCRDADFHIHAVHEVRGIGVQCLSVSTKLPDPFHADTQVLVSDPLIVRRSACADFMRSLTPHVQSHGGPDINGSQPDEMQRPRGTELTFQHLTWRAGRTLAILLAQVPGSGLNSPA